jgi:hypothetical protein
VLTLLSLLAHAARGGGEDAQAQAQGAFAAGLKQLGLAEATPMPREALSLKAAERALAKLARLAPLAKAEVVAALFAAVSADGKVRVAEAELMRLVGATLGCPVPPLLDAIEAKDAGD